MPSKPTTLPELIAALEAEVDEISHWPYQELETGWKFKSLADLMERAARVLREFQKASGDPSVRAAITRAMGEINAG